MGSFAQRWQALPRLGVGLSTEPGAGADLLSLRAAAGLEFLELGADVARGFDEHALAWIAAGFPTTYHFLDLNLEEPEDLDDAWLEATVALARSAGAAWLCGDAGLWHVGPRDRGHGTLLPPILCERSLRSMSEAVVALRERSGFEVLPENPPAQVLVGDLHPLEYFGELAHRADCGLLLDVAHLAIVQRALGLRPSHLLDAFPVERVVELHVAGGREFSSGGRSLLHDDHGERVHDDTWALLDELLPRAVSLRAVVVEAERNPAPVVRDLVDRVRARVLAVRPAFAPAAPARQLPSHDVDHRAVQRTLFRMSLDPGFAAEVREHGPPGVTGVAARWLQALDPALLAADPDDSRARQLLGNVATELHHAVRAAPDALPGFVRSPELHRALRDDEPLVPALAAYYARVGPPDREFRALLALDAEMARVRRVPRAPSPQPSPPPGAGEGG